MERKRKHTTSSGSPDFDDDSADSDLAYMHDGEIDSAVACKTDTLRPPEEKQGT